MPIGESGHGEYRTKAAECLKAVGLLRVVAATVTKVNKKKRHAILQYSLLILDFVISTPIRKVSTLYNKIFKNIFNFQTISILVDFRLSDTLFLARCPLLADVAIIHAEDKR